MANRFTTHFTNSDRSKIYRTSKSKIKNNVDVYSIPKGNVKISDRQKLIEKYLKKLDKMIYCKALEADVMLIRKGVNETKRHASLTFKSTIAALNLEKAIENATYIKKVPKKRNDKNQKCFKYMHLLICPIKCVGYAKIVVGEFYDNENIPSIYSHYCITHTSVQKIKK